MFHLLHARLDACSLIKTAALYEFPNFWSEKICLLFLIKSKNGLGPKYICDMFREYKPSRALRSKDSGQLVQPRVQTKHGEAAFSCYAANKWSKLPVEIKLSPNVDIFKSRLKTFLFSCVYAWNLNDIF